ATLEDVLLPRLRELDLEDEAAVQHAFDWLDGHLSPRALVDNACWAMRAAARGKPFATGEVPVAWIVTRQAPALMAAEAADMCRRHGLRSLKLKGGQGSDTDLEVIRQVRAVVGPGIE